jgi:hypothetical protein
MSLSSPQQFLSHNSQNFTQDYYLHQPNISPWENQQPVQPFQPEQKEQQQQFCQEPIQQWEPTQKFDLNNPPNYMENINLNI